MLCSVVDFETTSVSQWDILKVFLSAGYCFNLNSEIQHQLFFFLSAADASLCWICVARGPLSATCRKMFLSFGELASVLTLGLGLIAVGACYLCSPVFV